MQPDSQEARARFAAALDAAFDLSWRETRWLALAADRVAFAAVDDAGWRRLEVEAWLLERWRSAGVPAPRVVQHDHGRGVQVRERLHGLTGLDIHTESGRSPLYDRELPDARERLDDAPLSELGRRLAASYGNLAARIRRAVPIADANAAGLGLTSRRSIDVDDAIARLETSQASPVIARAARRARDWLVALPPPDAVIHADLHFFNMCVDTNGTITGLFDLSDAGIDAASQELSLVHSLGSRFAAIAIDAYGPVDVEAVRRAHLRSALDHVMWHGPGTPRHESIMAWASAAFERLL
jgi:hypothetical protein